VLAIRHRGARCRYSVLVLGEATRRTYSASCWKLWHTQYSSHWNDGFGSDRQIVLILFCLSSILWGIPFSWGIRLALSFTAEECVAMWSVLWTKNHLDWIDLRKAGHKAPTYRQMSNYCMQQDGALLPRKDQLSSYS
jgi:hypothetical protein